MVIKKILNYLGQLRLYSLLDLFILATALTNNSKPILGIMAIWISFILYLEYRHKDKLRLPITGLAWIIPCVLSFFLLPVWTCILFIVFSFCYTKKKDGKFWGISAPFWRGLQNMVIVLPFNPILSIVAFLLTFVRNLVGDLRDTADDKHRDIFTIPVVMGIKNNQLWAFYGHLLLTITTTLFWFQFSFLNSWLIVPVVLLQILSYPLTPRLSNPKFLNFYD